MLMMIPKCHIISLETVVNGNSLKLGAKEFVDALNFHHIPFVILSEHCNKTRSQLIEFFTSLGIEGIGEGNIYTSSMAAIDWVINKAPHITKVSYIGGIGMKEAIQKANYLIDDLNPEVVFVGMNRNMTFHEYSDMLYCIENAEYFISTDNRYRQIVEGDAIIGNQAVVKMLETASKKKAMSFGRGSEIFLHMTLRYLGLNRDDVVCIGSKFSKDIIPAHNTHIDTVYVAEGSGVVGLGKNEGVHPTYLVEDLYGLTI